MRAVVSLAWARLRHQPARWLLVALGVAAATVLPVQAQATATVVTAQALRHGLAALPPGARALAAIRDGLREPPDAIAALDATARHALAPLSSGPVLVQLLTRSISDRQGHDFYFGAADGLAGRVRLTDGRLPTSCTPARCEVVVIGAATADVNPDLGLVVVGRAVRTDPLLFGGSFDPGDGAPLLVADGVTAAAQLDSLSAFQRNYAWITAVDLDRVQALGVEGYLRLSNTASNELHRSRLSLTAPDNVLRDEADRSARSARRFALLGGAAMALLLGFAAIGAIGLRRDHQATVELLRRRGAGRRQIYLLTGIAAALPVIAGAVLGTVLGGVLAAWAAHGVGLPAVASALTAVRGAATTVGLGAGLAALVVAATLGAGSAENPRGAWRAVDATIGAGVLIGGLAVARGAVTAESLDAGTDALLLALPVIVVVCGGLAVGRAFPPVTAGIARLVPRRLLAARLGLLGAVRSPLRPVATAAFLAAATGIVAFAGSYQATLRQGALDQAAFAVPLDATVHTGASLRQPLAVAPLSSFQDTAAGVHPVVRSTATARINAAQAVVPALVGVDPAALAAIPGWDHVVGAWSAGAVAAAITPATRPALPGIALAAGTRTLSFPATGDVSGLDLTAWVRLPDGRDVGTSLALAGDGAGPDVVGDLAQATPAGSVLFAITVTENTFTNTRRQHNTGEGGNEVPALEGHLELGGADFTGWTAAGSTVAAGPDRLALDYRLVGDRIVLEPAGRLAAAPLPVFVDAATAAAASGGLLTLDVGGGTALTARLAGVLPRFPTTHASFVLADAGALADALDARMPGTGSIGELWLSGPLDRDRLAAAPFDLLAVDYRQDAADQLLDDPVALGAAGLLTASAALAFAVALLSLVLLVVAERRDESAQLYAWESDGVAPGSLRWSLFLRALAVVAVGVPGGVLVGGLLSRVTTALVRLTATGAEPVPPLALSISALWSVVAIGAGIVVGLVVCGGVAAASLRERLPRRPEEGLR